MEKTYRIVLNNGDKFTVKASGKETARKEALKHKELDAFGVHIEKIELVEASLKDYLQKIEEERVSGKLRKKNDLDYHQREKRSQATSLSCEHCGTKIHAAPGENCPHCAKKIPKLKESEAVDFDYTNKKKSKLKGPFGKNTDAMTLQGRADIGQRVVTARQGDNPLEEDTDQVTMLDRLHDILGEKGVSDEDIIGGVHFDRLETQKVAGNLGVSPRELNTLIASLIARLQSDRKSTMIQEVDPASEDDVVGGKVFDRGEKAWVPSFDRGGEHDARFSFEADGLGSITIRDAETGEDRFLQGHEATDLATHIEAVEQNPNELQEVLRNAFLSEGSVFDFFLREFKDNDSFDNEIKSDSGTYNMPWNLGGRSGFMTVFFSDKNGKPDLEIQSVRDTDGQEIETQPDEERTLLDQAKDFMQKEFS